MAQREALKKLKLYLQKLKEVGIKIDKAYLYGSYANNSMTEDSDIDIMIVSETFDIDNNKFAGLVWKLTKTVDTRIEPYLVGLKKFNNDDVSPLLQIVKRDGILITN